MKTLRTLILTLLLSLLLAATALAAYGTVEVRDSAGRYTTRTVQTVSLVLDGQTLKTDIPAFIMDSRTLVPVRVISEYLGASVTWKQESLEVQIENGRAAITLAIGSSTAVVNGRTVRLYGGVPATLAKKDGVTRTLVPVRFVSEQLGATVDFDSENYAVLITSPQAPTYDVAAPQLKNGAVTVTADRDAEASIFALPGRVVADFPGGVFTGSSSGRLEVDGAAVSAVRYNQYDQGYDNARVARVVFDLREGCTIDDLKIDFTAGVLTVLGAPAAPDPEPPEVPEEPPEELDLPPLVVLDAGHGGTDIGAPYSDLYEKDLTLPITLQTGALLEAAGYRVEYTRDEDVYVSLAARAEQANTQQAAIFVSIHANAFAQKPEVHGLETYHMAEAEEARALAESIHRSLLSAAGMADRGLRTASFYVLKNTEMPAVLVETGYMSNADECAKLASPAYQSRLAQGIAEGIAAYLGPPEP